MKRILFLLILMASFVGVTAAMVSVEDSPDIVVMQTDMFTDQHDPATVQSAVTVYTYHEVNQVVNVGYDLYGDITLFSTGFVDYNIVEDISPQVLGDPTGDRYKQMLHRTQFKTFNPGNDPIKQCSWHLPE
jgi:hypothetical protein